MTQDWNPDQAGAERKALFDKADKILTQPHYQEQASADSMHTSSADFLPQTDR